MSLSLNDLGFNLDREWAGILTTASSGSIAQAGSTHSRDLILDGSERWICSKIALLLYIQYSTMMHTLSILGLPI